MVSATALRSATLLGIATGIRSMTPLAALSWAASSGRLKLPDGPPFSVLATRRVAAMLLTAAAGEVVADKLPFTPPRTSRGPLLGRMTLGALAGATAFAAEDESVSVGALIGALAAAWGAFAGLWARTKLTKNGLLPLLAGVIGDVLAAALAVPAVMSRGSKVG